MIFFAIQDTRPPPSAPYFIEPLLFPTSPPFARRLGPGRRLRGDLNTRKELILPSAPEGKYLFFLILGRDNGFGKVVEFGVTLESGRSKQKGSIPILDLPPPQTGATPKTVVL